MGRQSPRGELSSTGEAFTRDAPYRARKEKLSFTRESRCRAGSAARAECACAGEKEGLPRRSSDGPSVHSSAARLPDWQEMHTHVEAHLSLSRSPSLSLPLPPSPPSPSSPSLPSLHLSPPLSRPPPPPLLRKPQWQPLRFQGSMAGGRGGRPRSGMPPCGLAMGGVVPLGALCALLLPARALTHTHTRHNHVVRQSCDACEGTCDCGETNGPHQTRAMRRARSRRPCRPCQAGGPRGWSS